MFSPPAPIAYRSTRGGVSGATFEEVLLGGLAPDGGLYVPTEWPTLSDTDLKTLQGRPYAAVVAVIASTFVGATFTPDELAELAVDAYADFRHVDVAPLTKLEDGLHLLELFWGPTLSFKDYAMQLLGRMFDSVLTKRGERVTIVAATSGDTGSAAIEALRGRDSVDVVILHPAGGVSDVQRRQMTTVTDKNIRNVAIEGTFDDCQDLVKAMFANSEFRAEMNLSAVNSINWGRIMAQISYYVWATLQLDATESGIGFAVPTGNFGNVYSGYAAKAMGLPIRMLMAGNNQNNGLHRFIRSSTLRIEPVVSTVAPAMDIAVPSNLERLLFDVYEEDGVALGKAMKRFRETGMMTIGTDEMALLGSWLQSMWMSDEAILRYIGGVVAESGIVIDPHTAIALAGARTRHLPPGVPMVAISTAHPAKFPDAIEKATGERPELPGELRDLYDRPEHYETLPNDLEIVMAHVRER